MFVRVCVGWVFFRAASIGDAWHVLTHAVSFAGANDVVAAGVGDRAIRWALIVGLCVAEWVYRNAPRIRESREGPRVPACAGRYALFVGIMVSAGVSQIDGARPFIYFQF